MKTMIAGVWRNLDVVAANKRQKSASSVGTKNAKVVSQDLTVLRVSQTANETGKAPNPPVITRPNVQTIRAEIGAITNILKKVNA